METNKYTDDMNQIFELLLKAFGMPCNSKDFREKKLTVTHDDSIEILRAVSALHWRISKLAILLEPLFLANKDEEFLYAKRAHERLIGLCDYALNEFNNAASEGDFNWEKCKLKDETKRKS